MAGAVDIIDTTHVTLVEVAELIDDLADGGCAGVLAALQRVVSTAQELQRRVMDRAVLRGEWTLDGFRSPVRWAAVTAGVPEGTARRLRLQAASFRELPAASAAALSGVLHDVHAHEITRCQRLASDRFDETIDRAFASIAASGDMASFSSIVREWRAHIEAEQHADPDQPPVDHGSFHLSESIDGRWFGQLELGPTDGQFVASAIERDVGRMLQSKRDGDPAFQEIDIAAMRAQALDDLVDHARRLPPGRVSAPDRYHVAFAIGTDDHDELAALLDQHQTERQTSTLTSPPSPSVVPAGTSASSLADVAPPARGPRLQSANMSLHPPGGACTGDPPDPALHPAGGRSCTGDPPHRSVFVPNESTAGDSNPGCAHASNGSAGDPYLPGWSPSPPSDAPVAGVLWRRPHRPRPPLPAEALCDCSIYRLVLGARGEPLDVGRAQRSWPAPLRNAIAQRDRGCRYPYCTAPIGHCDIHHCTHWQHGDHHRHQRHRPVPHAPHVPPHPPLDRTARCLPTTHLHSTRRHHLPHLNSRRPDTHGDGNIRRHGR